MARSGWYTQHSDGLVVEHLSPPLCRIGDKALEYDLIPDEAEHCLRCFGKYSFQELNEVRSLKNIVGLWPTAIAKRKEKILRRLLRRLGK